jgi:CRP-like cAMP-binding protein
MHHYLKDSDLPEILSSDDVADAPKTLVAIANAGGGHDNITAVVVRVEAVGKDATESAARASDLANRVEVLKQMPLFKHLTYKEIMRLLNVTVVKDYKSNESIIKEGSDGEELFIILSGKVRLHKADAFITHLQRGAHFGEMALVDRSKRSASATAEEPSRALMLRRRDFYEIIRKEPVLATKLLWSFVQVLTERLRKTTEDLSGARLEAQAVDLSEDVLFEEGDKRNWYYSITFSKDRVAARRGRAADGKAGSDRFGEAVLAAKPVGPSEGSIESCSGGKSARRRTRKAWATAQRVAWW